jgi:glyoxylase-like metal-dependent hydrolase (beta-lactamase superfamily II)
MSTMSADDRKVVVPPKWWEILPRKVYSQLDRVETGQPWFEVYLIDPGIYVIYEPGQFEEAISYLVLGEDRAALIDTGCGIGDIRALVEEFTDLPIVVVNTHSHNDHVAQNYMFDEVEIFDDPVSRDRARRGCSHEEMAHLISEGMTWKPLPEDFDPEAYHVPPFEVTRWLKDGDVVDLGGRSLEVIHTPGHSPDSVCLLERGARLLWTGDLFYTGAIYTYLPGGDVDTFIESYGKIIGLFTHYDRLMPSHNEPWVEKEILREVLKAVEDIRAWKAKKYIEGMDGDIKIRRYNYERFAIITRVV